MKYSRVVIFVLFTLFFGCDSFRQLLPLEFSFVQLKSSELEQHVANSNRHVLVEFGTNTKCCRCNSMREELNQLIRVYRETVELVKVEFDDSSRFAKRYGTTVCPTYALFERGRVRPVFVKSYPVTRDNLEAEILAVLALAGQD